MKTTKELLDEWNNFTSTREQARYELSNPEGAGTLRNELAGKTRELQQIKAEVQMLKARIALAQGAGVPYSKAMFDMEWASRKVELKEAVEQALMAELGGKSIPKIMHDLNMRNTVWLYRAKQRLEYARKAQEEELEGLDWLHSDFTGTHRFALAEKSGVDGFSYVKMAGTLDTDLEGEYAVFDYVTGAFVAGNHDVYESDSRAGRTKRAQQLAQILGKTYTGQWKASPNPYFGGPQ